MLIAHISDTHVVMDGKRVAGRFDTAANFERLIEALRSQPVRPDVILFSGDLGEDGTDAEYARIGDGLRALDIPVLAVPGNHDLRAPMRRAMPDMTGLIDKTGVIDMTGMTGDGHLCLADDRGPLVIVGLDTVVEGEPHGALCRKRLDWLGETLSLYAGRDTIVFMHHPPIVTGLAHLDSMGLLEGRVAFADIIMRHGHVEAVLCGHMHRAIQGRIGDVPVFVAPSASHQFALDLRPDQPYAVTDEPAQFMLHLKQPGRPLISHTAFV